MISGNNFTVDVLYKDTKIHQHFNKVVRFDKDYIVFEDELSEHEDIFDLWWNETKSYGYMEPPEEFLGVIRVKISSSVGWICKGYIENYKILGIDWNNDRSVMRHIVFALKKVSRITQEEVDKV